jgi:hypothetical protein
MADVTVEEIHHDRVELTEHPVERGGVVSDHAFKRPAEIVIRCGFSNSSPAAAGLGGLIGGTIGGVLGQAIGGAAGNIAAGIAGGVLGDIITGGTGSYVDQTYANFLTLQEQREPFTVLTGKRTYKNMVITSLSAHTDHTSENALMLTVECKEVIFVDAITATVGPSSGMKDPSATAPAATGWTASTVPSNGYTPANP